MRISDWSSDVCSSDLAKAVKNAAEIAGHRAASVRDGAALSRFLRWVEQAAPKGGLTELDCVAKLLEFRQATGVPQDRPEARRGGKGWSSPCRSRRAPAH